MQKALTFYDTQIGKKAVVAVTGIILYGFVIVHMAGNLQVFWGPEVFNGYAQKLRDLGPGLWLARGVLLLATIAHIVATMQLVASSAGARRFRYKVYKPTATNYAALTMRISGPLLFLYILFHLAHFTVPGVALGRYDHQPHDVYANFVNGFSEPWVTGIYVAAQLLLGFHLYHGSWSLFQSLGLSHPRYDDKTRFAAQTVAMVVVFGNIAMPIAVLLGLIK
jgi:succinate dehydrogenase / fumarate reductase cytochrome b subunit